MYLDAGYETKDGVVRECGMNLIICEKSSIFVLLSRFEGWGLTLVESMANGVPCVSYDCPYGPSDIIRNGEDGFLTKYMDPQDMVDKVLILIENSDIRKKWDRLLVSIFKDSILIK